MAGTPGRMSKRRRAKAGKDDPRPMESRLQGSSPETISALPWLDALVRQEARMTDQEQDSRLIPQRAFQLYRQ